ncbi:hypothetical protein ALC53_12463 [Atta colombica]|uniref:Uncharacterized protein n=1 Tax=Atta colombica TaxID=520822 RepID=A0A195AY44_9HYME|nr:hypothetical protein ALC53_12463 [Atta colombica]
MSSISIHRTGPASYRVARAVRRNGQDSKSPLVPVGTTGPFVHPSVRPSARRKSDPPSISTRERREAERKRRIPGIPKALHLTPPSHDGRDGDKSGAVAGESHALVNRVAGPFMSSANSSTVAEVAVRSCVHAGKVFFSVCFTGGQGYRGGKRNVAKGVGGGGAGGGGGESFTLQHLSSSPDVGVTSAPRRPMLTGASDSESPSNAVQLFEARVLSCRECEIEWERECGAVVVTVRGSAAAAYQDAVVSVSEIIMWCDVSQRVVRMEHIGERRGWWGEGGGDTVITNHQGAASSWLPRRQQPDLL